MLRESNPAASEKGFATEKRFEMDGAIAHMHAKLLFRITKTIQVNACLRLRLKF
jgi:hypothetical protein